ncbi:hypothetical protein LR48_Vigan01g121500 [Vigna angularis]|uniref:Legume lectin domain-containing protein n=1 Tax=Phaseolus angularis TaxID=3914 RepID=A0A0L9TM77_PHAAN|nr:hypothetical protein LR48_Vigan01g121500 [Vigna angularis]
MAKTRTPFPLLMISFCFVLLVNNVKSDSLSFSFSKFEPGIQFDIGFLGDARVVDGAIQLTRRDGGSYDNPIIRKHSVDRAVYIPPVRLWDKTTGTLANFGTLFTFVVDSAGSQIHTDGLSFFISPFDVEPSIPNNTSGGYLGLFTPEKSFNADKNQIVAILGRDLAGEKVAAKVEMTEEGHGGDGDGEGTGHVVVVEVKDLEIDEAGEVGGEGGVEGVVGEVEMAEGGECGEGGRDWAGELVVGEGEVGEETEVQERRRNDPGSSTEA